MYLLLPYKYVLNEPHDLSHGLIFQFYFKQFLCSIFQDVTSIMIITLWFVLILLGISGNFGQFSKSLFLYTEKELAF